MMTLFQIIGRLHNVIQILILLDMLYSNELTYSSGMNSAANGKNDSMVGVL